MVRILKGFAIALAMCLLLASAALAAEKSPFVYLGAEKTTGIDWEGTYGKAGYVLLGYNFTAVHGEEGYANPDLCFNNWYIDPDDYNIYGGDYLLSTETIRNGLIYTRPGTAAGKGTALKMPKGIADTAPRTGHLYCEIQEKQGVFGRMTTIQFNVADDREMLFTAYSSAKESFSSPAFSGVTMYEFLDLQGNVLASYTFDKDPADASYVHFITKGSFILRYRAEQGQPLASAYFFDPIVETEETLSAELNIARSVLQITYDSSIPGGQADYLAKPLTSMYLVRDDGAARSCVAALDVAANLAEDATFSAGKTYEYFVLKFGPQGAYRSSSLTYQPPVTNPTSLMLTMGEAPAYTAGDMAHISARLLADGKPCAGEKVRLSLEAVIENNVASYSYTETIAELTTDENGCISFADPLLAAGRYTLRAIHGENYQTWLSASESEAITLEVQMAAWNQPPVIFKMSDAIRGDELISISGEGVMGNVQVMAEPLTRGNLNQPEPGENALALTIVQQDEIGAHYLVVQMPKNTPSGVYQIWVKNDFGWSAPYQLNAARAIYISEYEVQPGMPIDVAGRNFDLRQIGYDAHYTQVRLMDEAGNAYPQTVTEVNPYRVQFRVKDDTPLGTYRVQVSCNNGILWSDLEMGQTLTVVEKGADPLGMEVAWASSFKWDDVFNVVDYGAISGDDKDDTGPIWSAIMDAQNNGGGVVYFPEGTYHYTTLQFVEDVVYLGDGPDKTTLIYHARAKNLLIGTADPATTKGHFGMANMTVTVKSAKHYVKGVEMGNTFEQSKYQETRTASEMFLVNVNLTENLFVNANKATDGVVTCVGAERLFIRGCNITNGQGMSNSITRYGWYEDVTVRKVAGQVQPCEMFCFVKSVDIYDHPAVIGNERRQTHGFFGRALITFEDCSVHDLGYGFDSECFASDTPSSPFGYGQVLHATEDTVQGRILSPYFGDVLRDGAQTPRNSYLAIVITEGRGMGQMRTIRSITPDGCTVVVDQPWDVIPDSSSIYTLCCPNAYMTVYRCTANSGGTLCNFYGNAFDCVADTLFGENVAGVSMNNSTAYNSNRNVFGYYIAFRNVESRGKQPLPGAQFGQTGTQIVNKRNELNGKYSGVNGYAIEFRSCVSVCDPAAEPQSTRAAFNFIGHPHCQDELRGDATNIVMENVHASGADYAIALTNGTTNGLIVRNLTFDSLSIQPLNIPTGTLGFLELVDSADLSAGVLMVEAAGEP